MLRSRGGRTAGGLTAGVEGHGGRAPGQGHRQGRCKQIQVIRRGDRIQCPQSFAVGPNKEEGKTNMINFTVFNVCLLFRLFSTCEHLSKMKFFDEQDIYRLLEGHYAIEMHWASSRNLLLMDYC